MPWLFALKVRVKFKQKQSIKDSYIIAIDKILKFMTHVDEFVQKPFKTLKILRTNIINTCLQTFDEELWISIHRSIWLRFRVYYAWSLWSIDNSRQSRRTWNMTNAKYVMCRQITWFIDVQTLQDSRDDELKIEVEIWRMEIHQRCLKLAAIKRQKTYVWSRDLTRLTKTFLTQKVHKKVISAFRLFLLASLFFIVPYLFEK